MSAKTSIEKRVAKIEQALAAISKKLDIPRTPTTPAIKNKPLPKEAPRQSAPPAVFDIRRSKPGSNKLPTVWWTAYSSDNTIVTFIVQTPNAVTPKFIADRANDIAQKAKELGSAVINGQSIIKDSWEIKAAPKRESKKKPIKEASVKKEKVKKAKKPKASKKEETDSGNSSTSTATPLDAQV